MDISHKKIMLERGCRQGDPISPYLFVLSAEILSTVVRECRDVRGLMVGGKKNKCQCTQTILLYS